jgi:hypothetical protein
MKPVLNCIFTGCEALMPSNKSHITFTTVSSFSDIRQSLSLSLSLLSYLCYTSSSPPFANKIGIIPMHPTLKIDLLMSSKVAALYYSGLSSLIGKK